MHLHGGDTTVAYVAPGKPMEVVLGLDEEASVERIEVHEQLPVSKDERIEVELDARKTTANGKLDRERGIFKWIVEVPKDESKRLVFGRTEALMVAALPMTRA